MLFIFIPFRGRGLFPMPAVPAVAAIAVLPIALYPGATISCPGPVAVLMGIVSVDPNPVTFYPNSTIIWWSGSFINYIGRLISNIVIACTGCQEQCAT